MSQISNNMTEVETQGVNKFVQSFSSSFITYWRSLPT